MLWEEDEEENRTDGIPGSINNAFHASTDGLESICADARGALRDAFDSLAGFGREVLCCLAAEL